VCTPDPSVEPAAYAAYVTAVAGRIGADVVMPGSEPAMLALAAAMEDDGGARLAVPSVGVVARALDKELLAPAAVAAGLDVPPTSIVASGTVHAGLRPISMPAVAKPTRSELVAADGHLHRFGVTVVDTPSELEDAIAGLPGARGLVQPYVPGDLYAISGVAWNGQLTCAVHQAAQRIWPPRSGIIAHAVTVGPVAWLDAAVARFLHQFEWSGIFQLQFIRRGRRLLLIDFNPRLYASLALAVAAGANLPAIWVEHLLGGSVAPVGYESGVAYRSEEHDVRALALALRHGRFGVVAGALAPRRRRVYAVLALRDPLPMRASLHKLRRKILRK
jgi:predicted ATP-grasp superfamily ATP-dependent carboligase